MVNIRIFSYVIIVHPSNRKLFTVSCSNTETTEEVYCAENLIA